MQSRGVQAPHLCLRRCRRRCRHAELTQLLGIIGCASLVSSFLGCQRRYTGTTFKQRRSKKTKQDRLACALTRELTLSASRAHIMLKFAAIVLLTLGRPAFLRTKTSRQDGGGCPDEALFPPRDAYASVHIHVSRPFVIWWVEVLRIIQD